MIVEVYGDKNADTIFVTYAVFFPTQRAFATHFVKTGKPAVLLNLTALSRFPKKLWTRR